MPPEFTDDYEIYQASIFRHKKLSTSSAYKSERGKKVGDSKFLPYYAQQVSGSDPFFSFLLSIEPEDDPTLAQLILRQTLESVLLNILIIDERIAQALGTLKAKDEPGIWLAEKLYWMGIHVAGRISVGGEQVWAAEPGNKAMLDVALGPDGAFAETTLETNLPIHILLIHATRLNEIFAALRARGVCQDKEKFLQTLREKVPCVIVHSGRGKTEGDIPKSAPFLEYSTVEKYVLNEPSKFYLVQIARNVKGDKE